jgi:hypothetical protein
MKYVIILIGLFGLIMSCKSDGQEETMHPIQTDRTDEFVRQRVEYEGSTDSLNAAHFSFTKMVFSFDTIMEGQVVEHIFPFTNTGNTALEIYDARTTCGCTVPEYPASSIPPNGKGEILVRFNSEDKIGFQDKPVVLIANTHPRRTELRLRGYVVKN